MALDSGALSPIRVAENVEPSGIRFAKGVEAGHHNFGVHERIEQELGVTTPALGMDGQGKYAAVASGAATAYLRIPTVGSTRKECIWDHAAGVILIREAGGVVSDIDGRELDFSLGSRLETTSGIIAAPKNLHPALISAVADARHAADKG